MSAQDITLPLTPAGPRPTGPVKHLRVLLAGAHGMIGSPIEAYLKGQGHEVVRLVRERPGADVCKGISWNPEGGTIDKEKLESFDAVVHVASLPMKRWTYAYMDRWYANRVGSNRLLAEALA